MEYYNSKQVAEILETSVSTVCRWVKEKKLIGKINEKGNLAISRRSVDKIINEKATSVQTTLRKFKIGDALSISKANYYDRIFLKGIIKKINRNQILIEV